jgi:hypothetical protein
MAGSDGQRRMVFDVRGKRKHVVKVVYAILALLMGSSLFLLAGPGLGSLVGGGSSGQSASSLLEEQASRIERKLKKSPEDETLLASLVRTRFNAGNAGVVSDQTTGQTEVPAASLTQYALAGEAWEKYLKAAGGKPKPATAQQAATAFFTTAQYSAGGSQTKVDLESAAHAQSFVAKAQPTTGSLSTLAIYQFFSLDFPAGDKTADRVLAIAKTPEEKKSAEEQLNAYRKQAKEFEKSLKEFEKTQSANGKQTLENPLGGGLSGGTSLAP